MEAILRNSCGEAGVAFDVVEGSHVYVRTKEGKDCFSDWGEMPEELRAECLRAAKRHEETFKESEAVALAVLRHHACAREAVSA